MVQVIIFKQFQVKILQMQVNCIVMHLIALII